MSAIAWELIAHSTKCSWAEEETGTMNSRRMPDIPGLMEATIELLRRGVSDSDRMREQLAMRFELDCGDRTWRKFVNDHAWALVSLQEQGRIHKVALGRYELGGPDDTSPICDGEPLPSWARRLVYTATVKNNLWGAKPFQEDDLRALWKQGAGAAC